MKKDIFVINLWGLGDLIPTVKFLSEYNLNVTLITLQKKSAVQELIKLLDKSSTIKVISLGKIYTVFFLFYKALKGGVLIFSAPLHGKARRLALFLDRIFKNIFIAEEYGNIYSINENCLVI